MRFFLFSILILSVLFACNSNTKNALQTKNNSNLNRYFKNNPSYVSDGFDFPVGKPNAKEYYNAQKFGENNHLGEDWNGIGGGNTDLGDTIYSIANGYVSEIKNYNGNWGNVIRIIHAYNNQYYESLYAHCQSFLVAKNTFVKKGSPIATIGNCNGTYLAHLHFEIRNNIQQDIGNGYATNTTDYLNPTNFIINNRNVNGNN